MVRVVDGDVPSTSDMAVNDTERSKDCSVVPSAIVCSVARVQVPQVPLTQLFDMLVEHADSVFEIPLMSVTMVRAGMPSPRRYIPLARLPDLVDDTVSVARFEAAKVRPVLTVPEDTALIVSVVLA